MKSFALFSTLIATYAGFARALLVTGAAEGFAKGVTGGGVRTSLCFSGVLLNETVGHTRLSQHNCRVGQLPRIFLTTSDRSHQDVSIELSNSILL